MKQPMKTATAMALAITLALGGSVSAYGAGRQYDDFDSITSHVDTTVPQKLGIGSPSGNISTTADAYYITGTSNPGQSLLLNGDEVAERGIYGSFGVYVELSPGENIFTFTQGGAEKTVTITKSSTGAVYTTDTITDMYPATASAHVAGSTMTLKCTAPAGAEVTADYAGNTYTLTQTVTAQPGVPAIFQAKVTALDTTVARNAGPIQYSMQYNGKRKSASSVGDLYLYPKGSLPLIQVKDTAATIFASSNTNGDIKTVARIGAIDYVTDQTEGCYQLGMGGWVPKDSVMPILEGSAQNTLSGVSFSKTAYGERYKLTGSTNPIITSWQTDEKLYVELHHTTTGNIKVPTADSALFTDATVSQSGDSIILELKLDPTKTLWGHVVEYSDNTTTIYCKYKPVGSGNSQKPLTDIIVGLDAGHGGTDPGALGVARTLGPVEKDITYATTIAVKKRLESLGATVILSQRGEGKSTVSDRMQASSDGKADFYISLHCNSVAGNGLKPNGVEIYYYYSRSKPFAEVLLRNIVSETGRANRGVKYSSFRVTLNSLTPAVLVEMGFLSNPKEYDKLCSKEGIFQMANAIGNSLLELV
ncbi:MAG: N-acetylmuramoyl-L-alanine amidase [Angelakisella sp.]